MRSQYNTVYLQAYLLAALLSVCMFGLPAAQAAVMSADTSGGYGAQVLDIVLSNWTKPANAVGSTSVIVRITTEGRPFSCELRKSSGNASVDDAICMAVAKAAVFPPAPFGIPAEVAMTFVYEAAVSADQTAGQTDGTMDPKPKSYADTIMENARPHLIIPESLKGQFTATIHLVVMPDGALAAYKMETPSGSPEFDTAILRALLSPGVIPLPTSGQETSVFLTFALTQP